MNNKAKGSTSPTQHKAEGLEDPPKHF